MSDAVPNIPSIIEARKAAKKTAKLLRVRKAAKTAAARTAALEKAIKAAKLAAAQAKKAGVKNKSWLSAPVIPQKGKRGATLPVGRARAGIPGPKGTARINVAALRQAQRVGGATPVTGSFNGMEMTPVVSSNVAAVGYDEEKSELYVSFLNGSLYKYYGVDQGVYINMLNASSKGRFVWRELREVYHYARIV